MIRFWVRASISTTGRRSLVALALLLIFPLVASATQDRMYRAPARSVAPPAPRHMLELPAAPLENSRQGLDEDFGALSLARFLIKPEPHAAFNSSAFNPSPGSTEYGYQGREKDSESGLQFFRARSYDPMTGRFTSRDPVPYSNRYFFTHNDPSNNTDPTGMDDYGTGLNIFGDVEVEDSDPTAASEEGDSIKALNPTALQAVVSYIGEDVPRWYDRSCKKWADESKPRHRSLMALPELSAPPKSEIAPKVFIDSKYLSPMKWCDAEFAGWFSTRFNTEMTAEDARLIITAVALAPNPFGKAEAIEEATLLLCAPEAAKAGKVVVDLAEYSERGSELWGAARMKSLAKFLKSCEIETVIGAGERPGFTRILDKADKVIGLRISLPADATRLEVEHELCHLLDYWKVGETEYNKLSELEREERVLRRLANNRNWDNLTPEQQRDAINYIDRYDKKKK